jgi:hypothetical protein
MARDPAEIRADVEVAADTLAPWMPFFLLGAGVVAGWMMRRQPVTKVANTSAGIVNRSLQVASAIAAFQRFRGKDREKDEAA